MELYLLIANGGLVILIILWRQASNRATKLQRELELAHKVASRNLDGLEAAQRESAALREQVKRAGPYLGIADAAAESERIRAEATMAVEALKKESRDQAREKIARADAQLELAGGQAKDIVADALRRAEEIAGDAYRALKEADHLKGVVNAMHNKIEGYGDRYLVPTYSLLDELADAYSFADAGKHLKLARENSQFMVKHGRAATCNYVEEHRRNTAIAFVLDAFNGKVDSILSRTKSDNIGTLNQQLRDAFSLVNHNGTAFRDAQITDEYLASRLEELKWGVAVAELREKDREEQRQIKARIREEERAQREFEKAKRDAEKEEAAVRKAMERMQGLIAKANDEQRVKYELQLAELNTRLQEAESQGQRALSMAQQTRSGHVYIVSNVGSFGEHVYKVGMTRRLEPLDRVRELGDASVPFGFDVHAMIYAEDAPRLERELHRKFLLNQINKTNPRKEFFRVTIAELKESVELMGLQCNWTLTAEAAAYRETLAIDARINSDSGAREQWLANQILSDPVIDEPAEDDSESESEAAAA